MGRNEKELAVAALFVMAFAAGIVALMLCLKSPSAPPDDRQQLVSAPAEPEVFNRDTLLRQLDLLNNQRDRQIANRQRAESQAIEKIEKDRQHRYDQAAQKVDRAERAVEEAQVEERLYRELSDQVEDSLHRAKREKVEKSRRERETRRNLAAAESEAHVVEAELGEARAQVAEARAEIDVSIAAGRHLIETEQIEAEIESRQTQQHDAKRRQLLRSLRDESRASEASQEFSDFEERIREAHRAAQSQRRAQQLRRARVARAKAAANSNYQAARRVWIDARRTEGMAQQYVTNVDERIGQLNDRLAGEEDEAELARTAAEEWERKRDRAETNLNRAVADLAQARQRRREVETAAAAERKRADAWAESQIAQVSDGAQRDIELAEKNFKSRRKQLEEKLKHAKPAYALTNA